MSTPPPSLIADLLDAFVPGREVLVIETFRDGSTMSTVALVSPLPGSTDGPILLADDAEDTTAVTLPHAVAEQLRDALTAYLGESA